uniref:Uncharacterized protein n=1 Tax=Trichuris muris TaxID=70415 RepID=A0A5S6Q8M2_TRIMR
MPNETKKRIATLQLAPRGARIAPNARLGVAGNRKPIGRENTGSERQHTIGRPARRRYTSDRNPKRYGKLPRGTRTVNYQICISLHCSGHSIGTGASPALAYALRTGRATRKGVGAAWALPETEVGAKSQSEADRSLPPAGMPTAQ